MTDDLTPADVTAILEAARILEKGGAGPLPIVAERLRAAAVKADAVVKEHAERDGLIDQFDRALRYDKPKADPAPQEDA